MDRPDHTAGTRDVPGRTTTAGFERKISSAHNKISVIHARMTTRASAAV
jgi:hypothetical protein